MPRLFLIRSSTAFAAPTSMRYSLLNQFRGAFLGAILGNILGTHCAKRTTEKASPFWIEVDQWGFQPVDADQFSFHWGKSAIHLTTDLIHGNCWLIDRPSDQDILAGLAIATLPLSLYYHEDLQQQGQALQSAIGHRFPELNNPAFTSTISTLGFTLSLTLQHKLVPSLLISQLLSALALEERHPFLAEQLIQVQQRLTDGTGLPIALSSLTASPRTDHPTDVTGSAIALAMYAFLSTPADFRLALLRTAQMGYHPQITCALVGALSGAYNSTAGLPLAWQMAFRRSAISSLWGIPTLKDLIHLIDQLWSSWSGAYHPPHLVQHSIHQAIAAPRVIRPR